MNGRAVSRLRKTAAVLLLLVLGSISAFHTAVREIGRSRIEAFYKGTVVFVNVSLGWSGSEIGYVGLAEPGAGGTYWFIARRVVSDLSLSGMLRGSLAPKRVTLEDASIKLKLDRSGRPVGTYSFAAVDGRPPDLPKLEIRNASIEIEQEGRPPFWVGGVEGELIPGVDGPTLTLSTRKPAWGRFRAVAKFPPDLRSAKVELVDEGGFDATPERLALIPFLPPEVAANVAPEGPVGWKVAFRVDPARSPAFSFDAVVNLNGTKLGVTAPGLTTTDAHGELLVDAEKVVIRRVKAESMGGRITADGVLALGSAPRIDARLDLDKIDVARAPASWELTEVAAAGRLTGEIMLRAKLGSDRVDLSGTTGDAVIEGGSIQGFPFKRMSLSVSARGPDLRFESKPGDKDSSARRSLARPLLAYLSTALQAAKRDLPKIEFPRTLSTQVEFEDLDMGEVVARAESLTGLHFPIELSGKLSFKAAATIPIASLRDVSLYRFHGRAKLLGASIGGVDVGRLDATLDLDQGVLTLSDFRGGLVDRPPGAPPVPPETIREVPVMGDLPAGSFRGTLRVGISPPGLFQASVEGVRVPLGELAAPIPSAPRLSGDLTFRADASAPITRMNDAGAWTVTGSVSAEQLKIRDSKPLRIKALASLRSGRVTASDVAADFGGRPLTGRFSLALDGERPFEGRVDVDDWRVSDLIGLLPGGVFSSAFVSGDLAAHADVSGKLRPFSIRSSGEARLSRARVGDVEIDSVPIRWRTEDDAVVLDRFEALVFGGSLAVEARFPTARNRPASFKAEIKGVDASRVASALPFVGRPEVVGRADGLLDVRYDPTVGWFGKGVFKSEKLSYEGVTIGRADVDLRSNGATIDFEANAFGPAGRTEFRGSVPLGGAGAVDAALLSVGYSIGDLARMARQGTVPKDLQGSLGLNANLRWDPARAYALGVHGVVEGRELRWGDRVPLGRLQGVLARDPQAWRLDQIGGEILGGSASGSVWSEPNGEARDRVRFDLRVDRASLPRLFAFLPDLASETTGTGTLRAWGAHGRGLAASGEVLVPSASVRLVPVADLRLPFEMTTEEDGRTGVLRARGFHARAAGGRVRGEASMRLGADRAFQLRMDLSSLELETITRVQSNTARPGTGRMSGKLVLSGPDPSAPDKYRGRLDLDLEEASIVDIPVMRELDRFLGAGRGGLIEKGELRAAISNRQIQIESLALEGRLVQLHASGTIGLDGQVALEVAVNTNQIIPQAGQALVDRVPGLRDVLGSNGRTALRIAGFLSARLLKFRINGTIRNPQATIDPSVVPTAAAVGFFSRVFQLPLR